MKMHWIGWACLASLMGLHNAANAAIACSSVTATSVNGITPTTGALNLTGNITVNCTRLTGDPLTQAVYIGINAGEDPDGTAGRELTRQSGTQQLNYGLFRNATPSGGWSEGINRAPGAAGGGGLLVTITFSSLATTAQSFSYPYYLRVTQANHSAAPAGIYDDIATIRVRLGGNTGAVESTTTFTPTISKPSHCYFSSPPGNLTMNYIAFSATPATGSSNFSVSCTASTPYTMALSSTSGVLIGLNYSLALSATSSTGTGFAQPFSVNGSIATGQAGTCTTGSCTATSAPRTITITY
jgi:spore coat protein U-like protein